MTRTFKRRPLFLATTALVAASVAAMGGAAFAANTIRIDVSGTGAVRGLAITQDATNNSNTLTTNGAPGGGSLLVRGPWNLVSINQQGGDNVLQGAFTSATTAGNLTLNYGAAGDGGNNTHSLTIGATTAPVAPTVTVNVTNTDPETTTNTITDALNGTGLTYTLTVAGTDNDIGNTVASSAGAVTLAETFTGDTNVVDNSIAATGAISVTETVTGDANEITHTVSGATTVTSTVTLASNDNSVTNLSNGSGDKTFSVVLNGVDGNTIVNDFTGGSGTQSSSLLSTGTSRLDFALTAAGAGSTSAVTAANIVGLAGAAALARITQGAGATLSLTATGTGFTAGTGATGGNAIFVNQSAGATSNVIFTAAANNYFLQVTQ